MNYRPLNSMDEFRRVKQALFTKYGDAILMGTEDQRKAILKDLAPAARYAKVPAERLLTALAVQYCDLTQPQGASLGKEAAQSAGRLGPRSIP